jgi:hypothetical protein
MLHQFETGDCIVFWRDVPPRYGLAALMFGFHYRGTIIYVPLCEFATVS